MIALSGLVPGLVPSSFLGLPVATGPALSCLLAWELGGKQHRYWTAGRGSRASVQLQLYCWEEAGVSLGSWR